MGIGKQGRLFEVEIYVKIVLSISKKIHLNSLDKPSFRLGS